MATERGKYEAGESVSGAYEPEREYTLEEILSEFSGYRDGSAGEQAAWDEEALLMSEIDMDLIDGYESAAKPAAESGPDSDFSPAAHIIEEESQITAEAVAPEALLTPENAADPAQAASEHIDSESFKEDKPTETEKPGKAGKSGRDRKNRRRKQKIVEDFPDMPPEENPAINSDVDYTALFRMFADPGQTEGTAEEGTSPRTPDNAETKGITASQSDAEPAEEKPQVPAQTPLLAENSPDFRDILREFMMGDQHPIYADMPGIGRKAEGAHAASDELADLDAAIMSVIPKAAAITQREKRQPEPEPLPQPEAARDDGAGRPQAPAEPAAERKGKSQTESKTGADAGSGTGKEGTGVPRRRGLPDRSAAGDAKAGARSE